MIILLLSARVGEVEEMESLAGTHGSVIKSIAVGLGILVLLAGATTAVYYWINRRNPMSAHHHKRLSRGVASQHWTLSTPEQTETATFAMG